MGVQSALLGIAWNGPPGSDGAPPSTGGQSLGSGGGSPTTGIAAEYLRDTFHLQLDSVGWLLAASTAAIFILGLVSGRLILRWGVGTLVSLGLAVSTAALLGFALAPSWWMIVGFGFCASLGYGLLDTSMNTWFAAHHGARLMNWLHASFGVGATLGPLAMTLSLSLSGSWRWGYGVVAALHVPAAAAYFLTRKRWGAARPHGAPHPEKPVKARDTLRLPLVWIGIGMFVAYTGLEMIAGQWAYSLFTTARGVSAATAGLWVGAFWGSFTLGRIAFGLAGERYKLETLIRIAILGGLAGALLLVWNPSPASGGIALAIFGFSTAPIWAMLMLNTQRTLGPDHAPHAIGFQVSAASVGFGILPALAGVLARRDGLETMPWTLVFLSVVIYALFEGTQRVRAAK